MSVAALLRVAAACAVALAVAGLPTAVNPNCTASSCNFYYICKTNILLPNETKLDDGNAHCGQVDAAPSMPQALFDPANADKLALYIAFTAAIQPQDPFCRPYQGGIQLGTCASAGFKYQHVNEPGRRITWAGYPHEANPNFGPSTVFLETCVKGCGCCPEKSMLYNPGAVAACAVPGVLPTCKDGPSPNDPRDSPHASPLKHGWCGVCGPLLNEPRFIDFYFAHMVQNVCEPRSAATPSRACAPFTTPLACLSHALQCAWRVPDPRQTGTCGVTGCCSIYTSGPTCHFDCALCQSASPSVDPTNPGIPGVDQTDFDLCCDDCEFCSATNNGTIATEATCGQSELPSTSATCAWNNTKPGR